MKERGASIDRLLVYRRTTRPDLYGDTFDIDGIDTSEFEKNPVLLRNHDTKTAPVGRVGKVLKDDQGLWAVDSEILDSEVQAGLERGYLKLVMGFRVSSTKGIEPSFTGRHYNSIELLEVSVVPAGIAVQGGECQFS